MEVKTMNLLLWTCCAVGIAVCLGDESEKLAQIMYEWVTLDYDWPSVRAKEKAIENGDYIAEHNAISAIRFYKHRTFMTIPRWKTGVPSSLNELVIVNGDALFRPYPSWEMNAKHNCSALQYVQSMQVDPEMGWMWLFDLGRINLFPSPGTQVKNMCPAKLLVYDIVNDKILRQYEFPPDVVNTTSNFLNDIIIDRLGYAYLSDVSGNGGIVVYDYNKNRSHRIEDPTMAGDPNATEIEVNGHKTYNKVPINGITISPDYKVLYFCPLSSYKLYGIKTDEARIPGKTVNVFEVGTKVSQSDGLIMGQDNLYYGALGLNGVYKWERTKDMKMQGTGENVTMETQTRVAIDNDRMQWVAGFAFDNEGYLWFTATRFSDFITGRLDFTGKKGDNFRVWKVKVEEKSYLVPKPKTTPATTPLSVSIANTAHSTWSCILLIIWSIFA